MPAGHTLRYSASLATPNRWFVLRESTCCHIVSLGSSAGFKRDRGILMKAIHLHAIVLLAGISLASSGNATDITPLASDAKTVETQSGWEFTVAPYFWAAGISGDVRQFGLPEVGLGLIPGEGGTQLLPRRIGLNRAADLILTGRRVEAQEALRIGLADRLVPMGAARAGALAIAKDIATKSPVSLRTAKRALRQGADVDLVSGLEIESRAWEEAAFSADRVEGVEAFNLRRAPQWPSWQASGR